MPTTLSNPERNEGAYIVATFTMLIHAWQSNEFHEAARACDELEQLGIVVRIPRRMRTRKRVPARVNDTSKPSVTSPGPQRAQIEISDALSDVHRAAATGGPEQ